MISPTALLSVVAPPRPVPAPPSSVPEPSAGPLPIGTAPPSPAGPVDEPLADHMPPRPDRSPTFQGLNFSMRPMSVAIGGHRRFGDVWDMRIPMRPDGFVITCHPDHVQSLLTAAPADAPSLTGETPLAQILGPDSVLTANGARHMRERKLLLPPFHGEAVARYMTMISEVTERELDRWPVNHAFAMAPRMQSLTFEVIMRGVFGIGTDEAEGAEARMAKTIRRLLSASTNPAYLLVELRNSGRTEARGLLARMLAISDRHMYAVIRQRRAEGDDSSRGDVLSLLLAARDEDGRPLSDRELRDELMALVLAGHETTANSLSWTHERLLRSPAAYDALRDAVRGSDAQAGRDYVEATIHEGMRSRPVIPMIVRRVMRRWRFGLHHRDDVYPDPARFAPERFLGVKPGTYTWLPFGGGIRRCLGATLAMAEQRVVLEAIARRTDLRAPDPRAESPRMRNVTMIPSQGARIVVERVIAA